MTKPGGWPGGERQRETCRRIRGHGELGAHVFVDEAAVADQQARLQDELIRLGRLVGHDGPEGTDPVYADETLADHKFLDVGGVRIERHYAGHAFPPGDGLVWLAEQKIVFSGDIVYVDRMLGIGPQSAHRSWITAFEAQAAKGPEIVAPGHGKPTGPSCRASLFNPCWTRGADGVVTH